MKTKLCPACNKLKNHDKFNKDKSKSLGLSSHCKKCKSEANKERYTNNKDKILKRSKKYYHKNKKHISKVKKVYRENNREYFKQQSHNYYINNKDRLRAQNKQWREANYIKLKTKKRQYYKLNKEAVMKQHNKYVKIKYKIDINFRLRMILRSRLRSAIKNNQKVGSAVKDLGCRVSDLKTHLENQFYLHPATKEKMTWNNHGYYGWHIDHIIPLSSFDLTDRGQFLKACHYTNLQPLWMKDNLEKSNN